jgi:hypothetical protein
MNIIREALVILPQQTNDGASLREVQALLGQELVNTFGGVTMSVALGSWKQPDGIVKTELVSQFTVAYEVTEANDIKLVSIARDYAARAEQEVVYVRKADGSVEFVAPHVELAHVA